MKISKKMLILDALLIPIFVLAGLVYYHQKALSQGIEVTLPISGFDPTDILSGHYLQYRIDFGKNTICTNKGVAYMCLNQNGKDWKGYLLYNETDAQSPLCKTYIQGNCEWTNGASFTAGIEKFYIPEQYAPKLDQQIRSKQGKLIVMVQSDGQAVIKDLLIDNQPWQKFVKK